MPLYVIGDEKAVDVISKRDKFISEYCKKKRMGIRSGKYVVRTNSRNTQSTRVEGGGKIEEWENEI
jgi:hypothetical protein